MTDTCMSNMYITGNCLQNCAVVARNITGSTKFTLLDAVTSHVRHLQTSAVAARKIFANCCRSKVHCMHIYEHIEMKLIERDYTSGREET